MTGIGVGEFWHCLTGPESCDLLIQWLREGEVRNDALPEKANDIKYTKIKIAPLGCDINEKTSSLPVSTKGYSARHICAVQRVCFACGGRVVQNSKFRATEPAITRAINELLHVEVPMGGGDDYPANVCGQCRSILRRNNVDQVNELSSKLIHFESVKECQDDDCQICVCYGGLVSSSAPPGLMSSSQRSDEELERVVSICPKCFGCIKDKSKHKCQAIKTERIRNAVRRVTDAGIAEQTATTIIRNKIGADVGQTTLAIPRGGRSVPVTIGKQGTDVDGAKLNHEATAQVMAAGRSLTIRQMASVKQALKGIIPKGRQSGSIRRDREHIGRTMMIEQHQLEFGTKRQPNMKEASVVFCKNPVELMHCIMPRTSDGEPDYTKSRFKIGLDGGGGFLKMTVQCVDDPKTANSVNHVLLLAMMAAPENYHNLKFLFSLSPISDFVAKAGRIQLSGDCKVRNIVAGVMDGVAPCVVCTWKKKDGLNTSQCVPRTIELHERMLEKLNTDYNGNAEKGSKFCEGVENMPLFLRGTFFQSYPIPVLHTMLGAFEKVHKAAIEKMTPAQEKAHDQALVKLRVAPVNYHGGDKYNGNDTKKILANLSTLELDTPETRKYLKILKILNDIVEQCFTTTRKGDEFAKTIKLFEEEWRQSGMSTTPKVHMIVAHAADYLYQEEAPDIGLGLLSEQALESSHHIINQLWANYKCRANKASYGIRVRAAMTTFNYLNIVRCGGLGTLKALLEKVDMPSTCAIA